MSQRHLFSKFNSFNIFLIILSAIIVSSAFYTLKYPEFPFGTMMPFSLIPLFIATRKIALATEKQTPMSVCKKIILSIWFFGFIVQLISFFWVTKPIIYFGAVSPFLAYPLFALISLFSALYFPILFSPYIFSLYCKNKFLDKKIFLLPIALSMTLFEIYIPRFFDWSFGGLLSSNIIFSQLESLFGFNTGSLFIFYTSLCLSTLSRRFSMKRNLMPILTCGVVFLFVTLFGGMRVQSLNKTFSQSEKFRVGLIQPNFAFNSLANLPLPSTNSQIKSFQIMLEMSAQVIQKSIRFDGKKPNLVVWPESTAPDLLLFTPWQIKELTQLSKSSGIPFLIQTIEMKAEDVKKYGLYNGPIWSSSIIINSTGLMPSFFQKWTPMPFGEEFPLENKLPFLGTWYRQIFKNASKIVRGTSYNALLISNNQFVTPLICFDAIDQKLSYLSTKKGSASFFVNLANFVWMVDSNAGLELSLLDQMRAIENGRSMVVAANSGPSLAFDPLGQALLIPTELLTQNINFVDIPLYTGKTIFQTVYHWPLTILGLFSLCYLIYKIFRLSFSA